MNDIVSTQNFLLCRIKIKTNNCTKRVKILLLTTNLTIILSVPNKLTMKIKIIVNNTKEHQFLVMHLMIQTAKEMKMMKGTMRLNVETPTDAIHPMSSDPSCVIHVCADA